MGKKKKVKIEIEIKQSDIKVRDDLSGMRKDRVHKDKSKYTRKKKHKKGGDND